MTNCFVILLSAPYTPDSQPFLIWLRSQGVTFWIVSNADYWYKDVILPTLGFNEEIFKLSSRNNTSCAAPERTMNNGWAPHRSLGGVENLSRSASSRFSSRTLLKNGSISSKVYDCSKLIDSDKLFPNGSDDANEKDASKPEDFVSGTLYDMLQKEVLTLRKASQQKDQNLKEKDNTIEVCMLLFDISMLLRV